jgi:hypothetical protein
VTNADASDNNETRQLHDLEELHIVGVVRRIISLKQLNLQLQLQAPTFFVG